MSATRCGFDQVVSDRQQLAKAAFFRSSLSEIESIVGELMANHPAHPWLGTFRAFTREREADAVYRGSLPAGYHFVFYPLSLQGIWFAPADGSTSVGILGDAAKHELAQLLA
ncbi:MAG: hypothetical protein E6Q40_16625 [Cupriavidus sp.]|jgi:hypothetical protein|nr:MAG: hypothetical protein E6Q40_16625 [Cupriavidus sp.]